MALIDLIQQNAAELPPDKQVEVLDFISFLRQRQNPSKRVVSDMERTQSIKKSLKALANMRVFADIHDPIEWQRSLRQDRPLPGRE
jgi:hypothetical protein